MNGFWEQILPVITSYGIRIAVALLVYTIGTIIIKLIHKALRKGKLLSKTEGSVKSFTLSFVKIGLYVILIVSVIAILGVPMASVITVLASAGVAIGLAAKQGGSVRDVNVKELQAHLIQNGAFLGI